VNTIDSQQNIQRQPGILVAPATALIVAGVLKIMSVLKFLFIFTGPVGWFFNALFSHLGMLSLFHWSALFLAGGATFKLAAAAVVIYGAAEMMHVRRYEWAVAAAIVSIVSGGLLGIGFGIWALVVLLRPEIKATFTSAPNLPSFPALRQSVVLPLAIIAGVLLILAMCLIGFRLAQASFAPASDPAPDPEFRANSGNTPMILPGTIAVGDATKFFKTLAVGPVGKLMLKADRGDIRITGSDQTNLEIRVDRAVRYASDSVAAKILEEERMLLTQDGDNISLTAHEPASLRTHRWRLWKRQPDLEVHYDIIVPRKFTVQAETLGGGVKVANIQAGVNVKTMGGNVDLKNMEGETDGETMGGDIHAIRCTGALRVHTMGGGIDIEKFSGSRLRANTAGGSITAEFLSAPKSDCDLHTMGGNVTARIPKSAVITLDAHTMGGSVTSDLPVQVEGRLHDSSMKGTINGGGPLLKLATMGGSINVRQTSGDGI
jgi:hypothetical protein